MRRLQKWFHLAGMRVMRGEHPHTSVVGTHRGTLPTTCIGLHVVRMNIAVAELSSHTHDRGQAKCWNAGRGELCTTAIRIGLHVSVLEGVSKRWYEQIANALFAGHLHRSPRWRKCKRGSGCGMLSGCSESSHPQRW